MIFLQLIIEIDVEIYLNIVYVANVFYMLDYLIQYEHKVVNEVILLSIDMNRVHIRKNKKEIETRRVL